ncbi:uncharacterized protein GGS22DRAFT_172103 [Annulohypoxylon maeteangense]|uniref:uncharacterized protein n=1 Tax=Annulohypoxylon maeteangense TaxID=1927788 RepID=UPI002007D32A|nr:uncharacterized protein GGS22DRAFT_172103 [Annulohypoxylon maeteangense]KAI0881414.1 hypothetical protein GGS22DRAFT_172103 [Annulohypoxylon maeteangense]
MPYDAPSSPPPQSNANANRAQMPSLSAAAARAVNRNPLTPKIASKTQQTSTLATIATPTNRRQQHPALVTASRETPSNRSVYIEDSSFVPHLSSNVTPRSGSRQNRVDSANSTPSGTPNPERSEPWDPRSSFCLPSPRLDGDAMRRSAASFSSISPDAGGHGRYDASHNSESKFFHASDVKPSRPTSSSKVAQAKGPTFFYANGNTIENNKPTSPTSFTASLSHSQDNISSKFMYANGTPEMRHTPTPPISRSSGSVVSIAPKPSTTRPTTNPPGASHALAQRPSSPAKLSSQVPQASSKPNNTGRQQVLTAPQLGPSPGLRRSSTGTSRVGGHSRTGSLVKGDQFSATPKLMSAHVSPEASPPITVPSTPAPLTLASIIQAAEDFAEDEESEMPDEIGSGLQSPTKSVHSTEPVNELVANARRERKVQDLQITNASLEAINRTLERQLRKQTAELRRFRRLSRAGRLSLPSTLSGRTSLDVFSEHAIGTMVLSDLDEQSEVEKEEKEGKEDEEDGGEESSLESDSASGSLSPSIVAERDAKHRRRDEERLQVDLSKHQQLLIDSQKINQSIKRCLDWTEELINEGKKALQTHIRASDVELGGRVLVVDPLDDDDDRPLTSDGSRDDTSSMLDEILDEKSLEGAGRLAGWNFERQDRDSGIELPADGG